MNMDEDNHGYAKELDQILSSHNLIIASTPFSNLATNNL